MPMWHVTYLANIYPHILPHLYRDLSCPLLRECNQTVRPYFPSSWVLHTALHCCLTQFRLITDLETICIDKV